MKNKKNDRVIATLEQLAKANAEIEKSFRVPVPNPIKRCYAIIGTGFPVVGPGYPPVGFRMQEPRTTAFMIPKPANEKERQDRINIILQKRRAHNEYETNVLGPVDYSILPDMFSPEIEQLLKQADHDAATSELVKLEILDAVVKELTLYLSGDMDRLRMALTKKGTVAKLEFTATKIQLIDLFWQLHGKGKMMCTKTETIAMLARVFSLNSEYAEKKLSNSTRPTTKPIFTNIF